MKSTSCLSCKHLVQSSVDPNTLKTSFNCTRFPPTPSLIPTAQGVVMMQSLPTITEPAEFLCGEYCEPEIPVIQ